MPEIFPKHVSHQQKRSKSRFRHQSQSRKPTTQIFPKNSSAQSPEAGKASGRLFRKEGCTRGENPFHRKKGFSSLVKFYSFSKLTPPKVLGNINEINNNKYKIVKQAQILLLDRLFVQGYLLLLQKAPRFFVFLALFLLIFGSCMWQNLFLGILLL